MKAQSLSCHHEQQVTPFQSRVYRVVATIPEGKVVTYKELAQVLGCSSCQAVGQALRRNPFAPTVPCHRVIKSDLTPGGYAGKLDEAALQRKLELLASEGVVFVNGVLRDTDKIFTLVKAADTQVSSAF